MTGGLAGPLAALALMPAAAAATLSGGRYIAVGAALTAATVAAIALAANAGLIRAPALAGPWLPLVIVLFAALGLAVALQLAQARGAQALAAELRETERLKTLLEAGPLLLLLEPRHRRRHPRGVLRRAGGLGPEAIGRPFGEFGRRERPRRARSALEIVLRTGAASVGFAPPHALATASLPPSCARFQAATSPRSCATPATSAATRLSWNSGGRTPRKRRSASRASWPT